MALDIKESLEENRSFIAVGIVLFVVMVASIAEFTFIDTTTHDYYALPWGMMCYLGNMNNACTAIQTLHNCPNGGDACIEARYYFMLSEESFWLAGLLVFLKMAISHLILKHKLNFTRGFQAFVWGTSPIVLLWFGWEDFLYYIVKSQAIPPKLDWLNSVGLFPFITPLTGDSNVSPLDLYIAMFLGIILISSLFYLMVLITKRHDYASPL